MSIPDKDQVREALERYRNAETLGEAGYFTTDVLAAVARAFVEGRLIPGEVDYEAAAEEVARQDGFDAFSAWPEMSRQEWRDRAKAIVDAALAFQESGEK